MDLIAEFKLLIRRLGFAKLSVIGLTAVATLGMLYWVSTLSMEAQGLLYSGLDPAESAKISQKLDELKIHYDVKGDGSTILVPASLVGRARMELAGAGLPHQSGAGYELLDQQSPMNMTSFMQRIQRLRALEGELARTIVNLDAVRTARVHIVLPERESFARETPKPTASVAVTMAGAARLSIAQASAIRLLVSGAVPGMAAASVSVLDPSGVVMAADDSEAAASNRIAELREARERDLRRTVTELLEPLIGRGKVHVAVSTDLDASREISREEKFDPLSQVERSKQFQMDQDTSSETKGPAPVTVSQNLPNQNASQDGAETPRTASSNSRNGQTINYEISSTRSERIREAGGLKRMTVAVVVDGIVDEKGQYTPRPQEELARLSEVIQAAVGFDASRGDRVTVESMRFLPGDTNGTLADADMRRSSTSSSIWIALGALALILLAAAFFLTKMRGAPLPLPRLAAAGGWASPQEALAAPSSAASAALTGQSSDQAMIADQTQQDETGAGSSRVPAIVPPKIPMEPEREALLAALFELVDARPDEAAATIRAWLSGAA